MDGIIVINKEKNWTSNDIVQKLKGMFHEKTGHTGTLDPQATGVLPVLIGKGTCLSKYLVNHDKDYIATIKLGKKTSTGDREGDVIEEHIVTENMLDEKNVKIVLDSFIGKQTQVPPMYSAIKVNGKKLYEYARQGKDIDVKPRGIEIYDIKLISVSKENCELVFETKVSKGTYIRTLCEDISERLGTVGFMEELNRTRVGDFRIEQAVKISEISNCEDLKKLGFISVEDFFANNGFFKFDDFKINKFLNGAKVFVGDKFDGVYRVYEKNMRFVGTGVVCDGVIKRDIVIL